MYHVKSITQAPLLSSTPTGDPAPAAGDEGAAGASRHGQGANGGASGAGRGGQGAHCDAGAAACRAVMWCEVMAPFAWFRRVC